jgi:parallel beta-helix repeat protein
MSKLHSWLLACALIAPSSAFAVNCGDTITSNLTLTSDLHCSTGWTALYVPTSGVTINLNGHTLSGTPGQAGISLSYASGVTIKGPGRISGFWSGVNTLHSDNLTVTGIDFEDLGMGVTVALSQKNVFSANSFTRIASIALSIDEAPTTRFASGSHSIVDNVFEAVRNGINLCGMDTGGSNIAGNSFGATSESAIQLRDGSQYNTIRSNVITDTGLNGIVLRGSSSNTVENNLLEYGNMGISLYPEYGSCIHPSGAAVVGYNKINGNVVRKHETGIHFGFGLAYTSVYKNWANYNQLHDDGVGMYFRTDAYSNGGTTNDYTGTATPAIDENGYNLY